MVPLCRSWWLPGDLVVPRTTTLRANLPRLALPNQTSLLGKGNPNIGDLGWNAMLLIWAPSLQTVLQGGFLGQVSLFSSLHPLGGNCPVRAGSLGMEATWEGQGGIRFPLGLQQNKSMGCVSLLQFLGLPPHFVLPSVAVSQEFPQPWNERPAATALVPCFGLKQPIGASGQILQLRVCWKFPPLEKSPASSEVVVLCACRVRGAPPFPPWSKQPAWQQPLLVLNTVSLERDHV